MLTLMSGFLNPTLAVVVIVIALLSGVLSIIREGQLMYAPAKAADKKVFWGWVRIAFILAACLSWWNEHSKVGELLEATQAAYITSSETSVAAPYYHIRGNWVVSDTCKNTSNVIARNGLCTRWITFVNEVPGVFNLPVVPPSEEERAYKEFEEGMTKIQIPEASLKRDFGPGEGDMGSVMSEPVDAKLDSEFRGGKKTIIFLAEYEWEDARGSHTREVCKWLQMPPNMFTSEGSVATGIPMIWHGCAHHDGLVPPRNRKK